MKKSSINTGGIVCLIALVYLMYRVLLHDGIWPFSISSVQMSMNHWAKHWHFLAVGLLPIYVALAFFGAAVVGMLFGSAAQRWLYRVLLKKD